MGSGCPPAMPATPAHRGRPHCGRCLAPLGLEHRPRLAEAHADLELACHQCDLLHWVEDGSTTLLPTHHYRPNRGAIRGR